MLAVTFRNISNLADVSDYEYTVLVGGGNYQRVLETGFVRGHHRSHGWEALVKRFLETKEVENGNT